MPTPPRKNGGIVTSTEVARRAGVSPATVSRAINRPELVAAATVARVNAAVELTGYVPNLIAGGLASRKTGLIAVIVPSIAGSIFNETIESMTAALAAARFQVMLGLSGYGNGDLGPVLDAILGRRPDGVIMTGFVELPAVRSRLERAGVPVIETWDLRKKPIDMAVGFSHARVGEDIARFLLALDYKHPALIVGDGHRAAARADAISATFAAPGSPSPPRLLQPLPSTVQQGRTAFAEILDSGEKADVIVCSSDWLALGVMIEAQHRGMRIPDDVGIIGFGDLEFAAELEPGLTTVRIDGAKIGQRCAELLVKRASGKLPRVRRFDVGADILQRGTLRSR